MQITPRPAVSAVTEMQYQAPEITRQTIAVEPPPTERLYAVRNGGGDGDFGGNGPHVQVTVTVGTDGPCLHADIHMIAEETRHDFTRGQVRERVRLWCNPDGGDIERVVTPTRATGEYTNTPPSSFIHQSSASCKIPMVSQLHFTTAVSLASPLLSAAAFCLELKLLT